MPDPPAASSRRILVTLCTYNERDNLPRLIPQIFTHAPGADVLVIDDDSPDGTAEVVRELQSGQPRLHLLLRKTDRGLGHATMAAFLWACERGYDVLVNMDADFSHPPEVIPRLIEGLDGETDVCIGSRYVRGGRIVGWPLKRHVMSRCINLYSRALLRIPARDTSGSFRAYRTEKLCRIDFQQVRSRGYSIQEELLYHCIKVGCRLREIPITFEDRRAGDSKINLREAVAALGNLFMLRVSG